MNGANKPGSGVRRHQDQNESAAIWRDYARAGRRLDGTQPAARPMSHPRVNEHAERPDLGEDGLSQGLSLGHVPPSMTLPEAVKRGIFGDRKYDAVRTAIARDQNAPGPIKGGCQGIPHEWAVEDLHAMAKELERP